MENVFTEEENKNWAKTLPGKMCSASLIIRSQDKVLVVKANYKDHWTFPGGIVDSNESPKTAAIREVFEETGLTIPEGKCQHFTIIYTPGEGDYRDRFNFTFIIDIENTDLVLSVPNNEISDAEWIPLNKVAAQANNRASYVEIQAMLTGESPRTSYIEL